MTERQALASRNFDNFIYSKRFQFIRHGNTLRGYVGLIEFRKHIFHYNFKNYIDSNCIELQIDLPIKCEQKNVHRLLGYLIVLNLLCQNQGIIYVNKDNRIAVSRKISYKYFVPSMESMELSLNELLTLACDIYDVIDAIAHSSHVPNNQRLSSRIYYDILLSDAMINPSDATDNHRIDNAFSTKTTDPKNADIKSDDIDFDDDEWGTLFF